MSKTPQTKTPTLLSAVLERSQRTVKHTDSFGKRLEGQASLPDDPEAARAQRMLALPLALQETLEHRVIGGEAGRIETPAGASEGEQSLHPHVRQAQLAVYEEAIEHILKLPIGRIQHALSCYPGNAPLIEPHSLRQMPRAEPPGKRGVERANADCPTDVIAPALHEMLYNYLHLRGSALDAGEARQADIAGSNRAQALDLDAETRQRLRPHNTIPPLPDLLTEYLGIACVPSAGPQCCCVRQASCCLLKAFQSIPRSTAGARSGAAPGKASLIRPIAEAAALRKESNKKKGK